MLPNNGYPQYALILNYDIKQGVYERYFRWISNQFVPAMQNRKLYLQNLWHIIGVTEELPQRRAEFVSEDLDSIRRLLDSNEWKDLEERLNYFSDNFSYRVIKYKGSFKI